MKIVCAWCGTVIRDGPDAPVSHGMCAACAAEWLRQAELSGKALGPGWYEFVPTEEQTQPPKENKP